MSVAMLLRVKQAREARALAALGATRRAAETARLAHEALASEAYAHRAQRPPAERAVYAVLLGGPLRVTALLGAVSTLSELAARTASLDEATSSSAAGWAARERDVATALTAGRAATRGRTAAEILAARLDADARSAASRKEEELLDEVAGRRR